MGPEYFFAKNALIVHDSRAQNHTSYSPLLKSSMTEFGNEVNLGSEMLKL